MRNRCEIGCESAAKSLRVEVRSTEVWGVRQRQITTGGGRVGRCGCDTQLESQEGHTIYITDRFNSAIIYDNFIEGTTGDSSSIGATLARRLLHLGHGLAQPRARLLAGLARREGREPQEALAARKGKALKPYRLYGYSIYISHLWSAAFLCSAFTFFIILSNVFGTKIQHEARPPVPGV